jgi:hypothetical protein
MSVRFTQSSDPSNKLSQSCLPRGRLVDLSLRASNEFLLLPSLQHHTFSPKGVARLSFTARIGRAQFYRARSASKKDGLTAPFTSFLGFEVRHDY